MGTGNAFGEFFKKKRLGLGLTLRAFCRKHALDVGNTSKMERGLLDPPRVKATLVNYAQALELKEETEDWDAFFELAAISAGRIPDKVMDDAELVSKLPLVFRTITGQRLTPEKLGELAEELREN